MEPPFPTLPFTQFPDSAKVWIYQCGEPLAGLEEIISNHLTPFIENWKSHGIPVRGDWALYAKACVLVVGDEVQTGVSGCSTDGMIRTIQQLSEATKKDFFNRTTCGLIGPSGLVFLPLTVVKQGKLSQDANTLYYLDPTVTSLGEMRKNWPIQLLKSWIMTKRAILS